MVNLRHLSLLAVLATGASAAPVRTLSDECKCLIPPISETLIARIRTVALTRTLSNHECQFICDPSHSIVNVGEENIKELLDIDAQPALPPAAQSSKSLHFDSATPPPFVSKPTATVPVPLPSATLLSVPSTESFAGEPEDSEAAAAHDAHQQALQIEPAPMYEPPSALPPPLFDGNTQQQHQNGLLPRPPPVAISQTAPLSAFDGAHIHPATTPFTPEASDEEMAASEKNHRGSIIRLSSLAIKSPCWKDVLATTTRIFAALLVLLGVATTLVYAFDALICWMCLNCGWRRGRRGISPSSRARMEEEMQKAKVMAMLEKGGVRGGRDRSPAPPARTPNWSRSPRSGRSATLGRAPASGWGRGRDRAWTVNSVV